MTIESANSIRAETDPMKILTGTTGLILAFIAIILMAIITSALRIKIDLTEDHRHTLSETSYSFIEKLPRDVTLKFYFSGSSDRLPPQMRAYGKRVRDLLKEYERHSRGRLSVEFIDPQTGVERGVEAERLGLTPIGQKGPDEDYLLYFGMTAQSASHSEVIRHLSLSDEDRIERLITGLIKSVTEPRLNKIGYINPITERFINSQNPNNKNIQQEWKIIQELRASHDFTDLSISINEIPRNITTLLIVHPYQISESTLYAIDQFLLGGGRLIAFLDPHLSSENSEPYSAAKGHKKSDLNRLSEAWGVQLYANQLVGNASQLRSLNANALELDNKASRFLRIGASYEYPGSPGTAGKKTLEMYTAGAFQIQPTEGLTVSHIATTSTDAAVVNILGKQEARLEPQSKLIDPQNPPPIAVHIKGLFKTAFPNGKPITDRLMQATAIEKPIEAGLKSSASETSVILFGDVDILSSVFTDKNLSDQDPSEHRTRIADLNHFFSILLQPTGASDPLTLDRRNLVERRFDKLKQIESRLKDKWLVLERSLSDESRSIEEKIASAGYTTLDKNPELKELEETYAKVRQQWRIIRQEMNKASESLLTVIKLLNLLVIPLAFMAYGLVRSRRRSREIGR